MSVPRVQRFEDMTPLDQALHLVHDHGFDASYFTSVPNDHPFQHLFVTDEAVVAAWVCGDFPTLNALSGGHSFPTREGRAVWHDDDHEEYGDTADRVDAQDWPSRDHDTDTSNVHFHGD